MIYQSFWGKSIKVGQHSIIELVFPKRWPTSTDFPKNDWLIIKNKLVILISTLVFYVCMIESMLEVAAPSADLPQKCLISSKPLWYMANNKLISRILDSVLY
jgi:hypothetical protein